MFSKKYAVLASALIAASLIASPATTLAGTVKAKCTAEAKKNKIAEKDMKAFMHKCYAEHKAKKVKKEKKEMKKEEKK